MTHLSKLLLIGECIALSVHTLHGHPESHLEIQEPSWQTQFSNTTRVGSGNYKTSLPTSWHSQV
jgi:hypothetical protein